MTLRKAAARGTRATTASLCGPLAALAAEGFRESGLTPAQTKPVVQAIFLDAVHHYVKSGRKVLSNSADPEGTAVLLKALSAQGSEPARTGTIRPAAFAERRTGQMR